MPTSNVARHLETKQEEGGGGNASFSLFPWDRGAHTVSTTLSDSTYIATGVTVAVQLRGEGVSYSTVSPAVDPAKGTLFFSITLIETEKKLKGTNGECGSLST